MPVDDGKLDERVSRDQANAGNAVLRAREEIAGFRQPVVMSGLQGPSKPALKLMDHADKHVASLEAIMADPFQAMVEVYTEVAGKDGETVGKEQLWYANANATVNEIFGEGDSRLCVLSWTHPGIQLALTTDLGDYRDVRESGFRLRSVEPLAKASFDATRPEISGVYDPGGAVRPRPPERRKTGLKAVKLDMTKDQVDAFVSRMDGLMVVTGAPGSGKTTVAFQRIRFLFDQKNERDATEAAVDYTPELTRVFLANANLADQAKELLERQLSIPASVVEGVDRFVGDYLDRVWAFKHHARLRQRNLPKLDLAARTAILGLSDHEDLGHLWERYERQIAERFRKAPEAEWTRLDGADQDDLRTLALAFRQTVENTSGSGDPASSNISMNAMFANVSRPYAAAREQMNAVVHRNFDEALRQWLYWVYDPLSAVADYFGTMETQAAFRIRRGTRGRANEARIIAEARQDWNDRIYGSEDVPWLAWLLRFSLSEEMDSQDRFREIPSALASATTDGERWTHVVIDEAQDISVAEASLLGSLVDPDGALTVSADFKQIVSPVRAMQNTKSFAIGRSLRGGGAEQIYPFARNMRQSRQIGKFLRGFHEAAFGEQATFNVNDALDDTKPQLIVTTHQDYARRIKQISAVLGRSDIVSSIALLQINEDQQFFHLLRSQLEGINVPLAPIWSASGDGLLMSSVERIKGLEFDACIVLGLEDVERAALNFTLNRAYVALSRPARRLFLICSEYPPLLRKMDKSLFDVTQS